MLCARCVSIFQDPSLEGLHHQDSASLEKAAEAGCRICLQLVKVRNWEGQHNEGERNTGSMLRYSLDRGRIYKDLWRLSFDDLQSTWAGDLSATFRVHVCESDDMPPGSHDFAAQAAQDLSVEPWRVRRDPFPSEIIPDSSGDERVAVTARNWLERCRSTHASCLQATEDRHQGWRPKRLVAVQNEGCGWRLVLREEFPNSNTIRYASLSHCWGPSPSFLMLTSQNLSAMRRGMTDQDLPQSFLDAIITVRRLGIEYIWIDSLCILQSGDGSEIDWLDNAAEMTLIYSNSDLNLSIDHASCPSDGAFVQRDPEFLQPCHVWSPVLARTCPLSRSSEQMLETPLYDLDRESWYEKRQELDREYDKECVTADSVPRLCTVLTEPDFCRSFTDLPLAKRAWVYQERQMSPRVLHFMADRIAWECLEDGWLTEYLPEGLPCGRTHFDAIWSPAFDIDSIIEKCLLPGSLSHRLVDGYFAWWDVINDYTSRELSHPQKDKLVALATVAKKFTSVFKSDYYAGMFRSDLPIGLLWHAPSDYRHRSVQYRAPSWSWASMDGPIRNAIHDIWEADVDLVELLDINVTLRDPREPYGQVDAGTLTLSGLLLPWFSEGELPANMSETRRKSYGEWDFTFHHSVFDQDVNFMFDAEFYVPPTRESLFLLPIRECWTDEFEGNSATVLYGLIIFKVGDGSHARVGMFKTNREGAKHFLHNIELRERIDIV